MRKSRFLDVYQYEARVLALTGVFSIDGDAVPIGVSGSQQRLMSFF
ncbi:MAG: hypothetical protein PHI34_03530 [Acidobacteriota bacterium]|nr:hypothetical protein [Acidobacteriota bacterium]